MLRRMQWIWLAAALLAGSASVQPAAAASYLGVSFNNRGNMDVSYFYEALSPYGEWIDYAPYGYVWTPSDVSYGWRPYTDGEWVYTDYGWTWVDYEPWGWAPMHYGRWVWEDGIGWIWVPGTTWAPAWVAWASGDDWVGWAPLPPDMGWNASLSVNFNSFDIHRMPSNCWSFVDRRYLTSPTLRTRILPVSRNVTILPRVQNFTRFASRGGTPVNVGVDLRTIERVSGRPVPRMRLADMQRPANGRPQVTGNVLHMFRGRLAPAPAHAAPRRVSSVGNDRSMRGMGGRDVRQTRGAESRPMNGPGMGRTNGRDTGRDMNRGNGRDMNRDMNRGNGRDMSRDMNRGNGRGMGRMRDMSDPSASAARNQERQRFDVNQSMQNRGPSRRPTQNEWMQMRSRASAAQAERDAQARRDAQAQRAFERNQQRQQVEQYRPARPDRGNGGARPGNGNADRPQPRNGGGRPANGNADRPDNSGNGDNGDQQDNGGQSRGNGHGNGHGRGHGD